MTGGGGPRRVRLPEGVLGMATRDDRWAAWVEALPQLAGGLLDDWGLVQDGWAMHGYTALVLPVRRASGGPAILKVGFPHDESEHEALALQHWRGDGAVRLLAADPHRRALLLERLHPEDLGGLDAVEACEVVAGLYGRLHRPAPAQLRALPSYVDRWAAALGELPRSAPVPRRLVEQALAIARAFVAEAASVGTLVHGDLHYANVLAGDREPWLAIDPKPVSGDPHYEPAPMLWNRFDELAGDVRGGVRRRFHTLVDAADLDEDRARDWVVLRVVLNAHGTLADAARGRRDLTAVEQHFLTANVAIAKAVQD